ncbi:MAG: hypothetical protein NXI01_06855 [Gammaproteobacteria bacterium]|nr:hypothetical protein [Gammaproteobacteria bacterium]
MSDSEEERRPKKTFEGVVFGGSRGVVESMANSYDVEVDSSSSDGDWPECEQFIAHRPPSAGKAQASSAIKDHSLRTIIRPQPASASWLMSNTCANRIGKFGMAVFFLGLAMLAMAASGTTLFYLGAAGVTSGLGLGLFAKCCAKPEQEREPLSFVHA